MKKIIIIIIALVSFNMQLFADARSAVLLLHNGQGKTFEASQLQTAVTQAITGDTICLSEGAYEVPEDTLVIDKPITIMGTGTSSCRIVGNIKVAIDGEPTLVARLLDAVRVTEKVIVSKAIKGIKLRKCWIGKFFWVNEDIEAHDILIDRCFLNRFVLKKSIKSALIVNSVMVWQGYNTNPNKDEIYVTGSNVTFVNCNICLLDIYCNLAATYQNCIIPAASMSYAGFIKNNTFINTLFAKGTAGAALGNEENISRDNFVQNCWWGNVSSTRDSFNDEYPTFSVTKESLEAQGYLGTDGTIIGAEGGATPFTLETDGIHIKESILKVDPETHQLNVTLKVE